MYKEQLDFDPFLFEYRVSCHNQNLKIDHMNIDNSFKNQVIILDNLNIEEFCKSIMNCNEKMNLLNYIIERYSLDDQFTELYTNLIPTNEIKIFSNFNLLDYNKIDKLTIIPIFVSNISFKLLNILYLELKSLQKKRLLNSLLI